ncbi:MAG: hypothetical protein Ct9H300mP21_05160 [Pseudomonadota bacterium]|nr:MAG: hypothetical protein Ct9H300mP21_05160 [Pseudomonadota bacterium]
MQVAFQANHDIDITKETAPSLDIMRDLIQEVIVQPGTFWAHYMTSNIPVSVNSLVLPSEKKILRPIVNIFRGTRANNLPILKHIVSSSIKKTLKIQIRVEDFFSSTASQNELFYLTLFGFNQVMSDLETKNAIRMILLTGSLGGMSYLSFNNGFLFPTFPIWEFPAQLS